MIQSPILITGVPRSGTSMTAGCFSISGAWFGDTVGANKDNPKGFFENKKIREGVIKGYIQAQGYDRLGQDPLPPIKEFVSSKDYEASSALKINTEAIIKSEGYQEGPWAIKDAKLALTWPIWSAAYRDARWILVRRARTGIARSCQKTGFMRACSSEDEWLEWVKDYEERFKPLKESCQVFEIWFEDLITGFFDPLEAAIKACSLNWDEEKIREFIIQQG